jgi:hypothetical protein
MKGGENMVNNGKVSTWVLSIGLVVFGLLATNPQYLQSLMGGSMYLRYGAALLAVILAFYNYYYPRLKKMVDTGEEPSIDNGKISTFLVTAVMLFMGVFIADPTLLERLLGGVAYASYGPLILALIVVLYNQQYPRNAQSQPVPPPETPK